MKEKLIKGKNSEEYMVKLEGIGYITTYESTLPYKLSLKNCQAIEHSYDLNELANKYAEKQFSTQENKSVGQQNDYDNSKHDFKEGAKAILEILSGKRFNEEDIAKAIDFGVNIEAGNIDVDYKNFKTKENQFIQSLQQTEWDVKILTKNSRTGKIVNNPDSDLEWDEEGLCDREVPKLDSDGCLILKRI